MADKLPQHPFVESVKSAPSQPAKKTVVLTGLPGDSDQPDLQRLYLTAKLNYYAEFPVSAILSAETVPADQSPIAGQEATQVSISRDATIRYVTETSSQPIDEFDLDVRFGPLSAVPAKLGTFGPGGTCDTCPTQCDDFPTRCLGTCRGNTCVNTQCQQDTCVNTQCQQATCVDTQCHQHTCAGLTCIVTQCGVTCHHTCATCCGSPNTCV